MSELNMLQQAASTSLAETAVQAAPQGFIKGSLEAAKQLVADNPVAVAAGVTALVVAGVCYYGYRNWGWFSSPEAAVSNQDPLYTQEQLDRVIAEVRASAVAPAPVAPAAPAAAPVATVTA